MNSELNFFEKQGLKKDEQNQIMYQNFHKQLEKSKERQREESMQNSLIKMLQDEQNEITSNAKHVDFNETGVTYHPKNPQNNLTKFSRQQVDKNQPVTIILNQSSQELKETQYIDPRQIRESKVVKHIKIRSNGKPFIFQPLRIKQSTHISVDKNSILYKFWKDCCQNGYYQQLYQVTDTY